MKTENKIALGLFLVGIIILLIVSIVMYKRKNNDSQLINLLYDLDKNRNNIPEIDDETVNSIDFQKRIVLIEQNPMSMININPDPTFEKTMMTQTKFNHGNFFNTNPYPSWVQNCDNGSCAKSSPLVPLNNVQTLVNGVFQGNVFTAEEGINGAPLMNTASFLTHKSSGIYDEEYPSDKQNNIEHFDLNNDVPPHTGTLLPPPKPDQQLLSQNGKEDYYPINLYSGYYNWKPYQYHYYFYPYRRYLRPYYSFYKPGRWYRHYGNYYYVW